MKIVQSHCKVKKCTNSIKVSFSSVKMEKKITDNAQSGTFSLEGNLAIVSNPLKMYNLLNQQFYISKLSK